MSTALNEFMVDFYREILKSHDAEESLLFSPASVYIVMAMVYVGAREKSAEQLQRALHLNGMPYDTEVHVEFEKLLAKLTAASNRINETVLHIANQMWIDKHSKISKDYQYTLKTYYQTGASLVKFRSKPEKAREHINQWVAEKTNNKIVDLLPSGSISSTTELVLTNAIYFKGAWEIPFEPELTETRKFYLSSTGRTSDVSMMYQRDEHIYTDDNELHAQVLTLDYANSTVKMTIILPNEIDELKEVEEKLTTDLNMSKKLAQWSSATRKEIEIYIPKFKINQDLSLNQFFQGLGVKDIFVQGQANLSGINKANDLFVSDIFHKAFVEVNEEGTEAAAATGFVFLSYSMPLKELIFNANHPFFFVIHDVCAEVILFCGKVVKL